MNWAKIIQIAVTVLVAVINIFSKRKADEVKEKHEQKKKMVESDSDADKRFLHAMRIGSKLQDSDKPNEDI